MFSKDLGSHNQKPASLKKVSNGTVHISFPTSFLLENSLQSKIALAAKAQTTLGHIDMQQSDTNTAM